MSKDFHIGFQTIDSVIQEAKATIVNPRKRQKHPSAVFKNLNEFMEFLFPGKFMILMMIKAKSPVSLYELAQLVNRSQPGVLRECRELESMGFITLTQEGARNALVPRLAFDYDRIVVHSETGDCYHTLPSVA